ncbi:hypothetical protein AMJ80_12530 [bacterium SM23_31]|nr:MAG: hypothetical protein AMJ80_12530 [bacterium SM23_31]
MFKKIIMLLIVIACIGNFSYAFLRDVAADCKCSYGDMHSSIDGVSGCKCVKYGSNACVCTEVEDPES